MPVFLSVKNPRTRSLTVNLMAFSGATPTSWGKTPEYRPRTPSLRTTLRKQSSELFDYAFDHWSEHLEGAAAERIAPVDLESVMNAMKVAFRCLQRHIGDLMLVKTDAVALITCIQDAAHFLYLCIDLGELLRALGYKCWLIACRPQRRATQS